MKNRSLKIFNGTKLIIGLVSFLSLVFLSSCGDDDSAEMVVTDSIVDIAGATDNLTTLVTVLSKFPDLVATLTDENGTFTVFAPTDAAFSALLTALDASSLDDIADDDLRTVLEYHVISGSALLSTDLSDGATAATVQGSSVTVSISGSTISIDNATVSTADIEAVNGIIHIVDAVLVPSGVEVIAQDIVDIAAATSDLSSLVSALTKFDDLVETLANQNGSFTVFAPTNEAFTNLLAAIGQTSIDDVPESVLRRILEYHVVSGAELLSSGLSNGATAATVLGDDITVGVAGSAVTINSSNVTTADVVTANGVVHIIDAVLVPELEVSILNTVVQPAYFSKNFTILTEAVVTAELLTTLTDESASLTVFAPDNDAFEEIGITSLEGLTKADLEPILLYHVLGSKVMEAGLPATGSAVTTLGGDFYLSINTDGVFINGNSQVTTTDLDYGNGVVHLINRTLEPASDDVVQIAVDASMASTDAEFGQLVAALTAVENDETAPNLITALSDENGSFTVFAPTDAAFQALYDLVGDQDNDGDNDITDLVLATDLSTIATVLQYHVLDSRVFSSDIPNVLNGGMNATITPLAGGTWTLNSDLTITDTDGALTLSTSDASIVDTNILGTNGVIHVIDQVILP